MTSLELLEVLGTVKGKYILEAHREEFPGKNFIPFEYNVQSEGSSVNVTTKQSRKHVSKKKSVLVAIIAATMLMLAGFAYAIIRLQEASLGDYTYTQPNPMNPTEKLEVTSDFMSLQGLQDSPEYKATKEWQDFLNGYDIDGKILDKIGNGPTGLEDLSLFYQVYTQEMYNKLSAIADKYGLNLHSKMDLVSQKELDYRVGAPFVGDEISRGWAYIFENGTFQFDGDTVINGAEVLLQLRRTVKGTLDEPVLNIGSVEEYQEVQYETVCGESVLLELGKDHSFIYVDYDECFILLNVLAGREMGILTEATITIEDLKRMADEIDFTILKDVIKPDMRGDSEVETSDISSEESSKQPEPVPDAGENSLFDRFFRGEIAAEGNGLYGDDSFYINQLPMDEETWDSYSFGGMLDLDNDGEDELILNGPYGGMYLDDSYGVVKVLAIGEGTASNLSYTKCGGEVWIVHSDILHSDRKYYHLEMYAGADKIAGVITLEIRYSAENRATYFFNDTPVSEGEYQEIYHEYFGDGRIEAYQSLLSVVYQNQTFPCGRELGYDGYPMSDNKFALMDIDGDGGEELILLYFTTYMGGQAEIIYDYDADTGSVREQFVEYPSVTHFDNGILKADWSHNQGLGGRIWPYTLYQYNPEKDAYEAIAMVDAWDKSLSDKDYEGNVFPDDVDKDGDLLIYYIMDADKYQLKNPVDWDEYEKWFESYTLDAGTVTMHYKELTEENIFKLK